MCGRIDDEPVIEAVAGAPSGDRAVDGGDARGKVHRQRYLSERGRVTGPSLLLITGPNMGGKSTYLRQAAMLVLLAQMGSFVPAESLRFGLVDRIYTRIGASDNVARGRSTFMVEMTETATILNTATKRSLILLDEMGRGTATFDGLSLAWATVEYLHAETGARTLFATHYHELTMLAEKLPRVRNLRVGVKEAAGGIVFLHNIEPGAASKSYGIEVARLAGLACGSDRAGQACAAAAREAGAAERAGGDGGAGAVDDLYSALAAHCGPHRSYGRELADAAAGAESAGGVAAGVEGERDDGELCVRRREVCWWWAWRHRIHGPGARVAQAGAASRDHSLPAQHCGCGADAGAAGRGNGLVRGAQLSLRGCGRRHGRPAAGCAGAHAFRAGCGAARPRTRRSADCIREHGELIAQGVKAFGFNTTLAPVLDLALPESAAVMGTRAAAATGDGVVDYARGFLAGLGGAGSGGLRQAFSWARRRNARFAPGNSGDQRAVDASFGEKIWFPIASCAMSCR